MDKFSKSEYLQKLYDIHSQDDQPCGCDQDEYEREKLTPVQMDNLKLKALNNITKHMCKRSIPCDDGCGEGDALEAEVDRIVNRYFVSNKGNLLQYFADTRNTVTDLINEAFDDAVEKIDPVDDDDDEFIAAVVNRVTDDEDVEEVIKKIEDGIKTSAENDIKDIIDDIKDEESEDQNEMPSPTDDNINESVFHHYLVTQYTENTVPDDPEMMLVVPMVETALHYVRRVLFSDGFARRMK